MSGLWYALCFFSLRFHFLLLAFLQGTLGVFVWAALISRTCPATLPLAPLSTNTNTIKNTNTNIDVNIQYIFVYVSVFVLSLYLYFCLSSFDISHIADLAPRSHVNKKSVGKKLATLKHSIKTQVFQHIHNQSKHTELSTKHWRSRASISLSISKSERIRSQVYAQTSQLEVLRSTKSKPSGGICVQVGSQISRASCQEIKSRKRGKKASKLRLGKSYLSGAKS